MTYSTPARAQMDSAHTGAMLRFPWAGVSTAIAETKAAAASRTLYGNNTGRGLWLVGDRGIYLMSNAAIGKPTVVYATECDPTKLPFETWWEVKQLTFGGDDGIEFISMEDIEALTAAAPRPGARPHLFTIRISRSAFTFSLLWAARRSNRREVNSVGSP